MIHCRRSTKLCSAVLASCSLSIAIAPSATSQLAPDTLPETSSEAGSSLSTQQRTTQQWIQAYNLPPFAQGGSLNSSKLLAKEDFVMSIVSFLDITMQLSSQDVGTMSEYVSIHANAVEYLTPRIEATQQEAQRLISEAEGLTSPSKYQYKNQPTLTDKMGNAAPSLLVSVLPEIDLEGYTVPERAQLLKEFYGIDMMTADGTLQLDRPLTQGDYIKYLRQTETFLAQEHFMLEASSLLDVPEMDPLDIMFSRETPRLVGSSLSALFEDWNRVRTLTAELSEVMSQGKSTRKTSTSHNRPRAMTKGDISQVPDVSPTDEVYSSLDRLTNEMGIDVMQPDGSFNGQAPIMRGEFVTLMLKAHGSIPYAGFEDHVFDPYISIYEDISQALQTTERDLQRSIAQIEGR